MALELGPDNIRANAIGPGLIVSDGTAANYQGEAAAKRAKGVPMGRVGDPTDIADWPSGFLLPAHPVRRNATPPQ